jgi:formate hydrogenlyase subunit 3/multisubunit Na+/H+ antiporter MnhD subunit
MSIDSLYPLFRLDGLNGFVVLAIGVFSVLTLIYSSRFMKGKSGVFSYYVYIILTALSAIAAVLANNLLLLLILWGFLGITLYLLINMGGEEASPAAKKTFIIVGGADALMLLGIGIIYYLTGTFQMDKISLSLVTGNWLLVTVSYLCLAIASFAKAGAMPFHSWVPDSSQYAPVPVAAYLLAALDKLLGIYLLTRISLDLFILNSFLNILLMLLGAFTVLAAVMMALIQHNMKRLLGYHAVSQVGYMVLGIGTGTPVGIAGGVFHMLNNALYKQSLFLISGNVEQKAGTTELVNLGGLSRVMPLTYISAVIASLSISGVPPFNGFVSKWMVYQGLIQRLAVSGERLAVVLCLVAAMFGSALTLASFMKLIHATFLGQPTNQLTKQQPKEVSWVMWLPPLVLAVICIVFGVFANQIPLKYFILPAVKEVNFAGTWYAGLSTLLIVTGLILGIFFFRFRGIRPILRQDKAFVGGEALALEENRVTGTEFYNTVKEHGLLRSLYRKAEQGSFDIYEQGKNYAFGIGKIFQCLHNGVLPTYLVWILLGMLGLFWVCLIM